MTLQNDDSSSRLEMVAVFRLAHEQGASDLHLVAGQRGRMRVHGELRAFGEPVAGAKLAAMVRSVAPAAVAAAIAREADSATNAGEPGQRDFDFSVAAVLDGDVPQRFRFNVFYSQGKIGACIRLIGSRVPSVEWARLPEKVVERVCEFRNGLVLVTGVAGSGKSTTLAILLERMVEQCGCRVITIEEPIEYIHPFGDNALITQREVGVDVASFADGLKYGLRQDPDVIMVGEIRDPETAQMALTAAETGHLVLSTLHTRDARGAVSRFTDLFPRDRSEEICAQLATNLRAVLSQHLLPSMQPDAKRVLALEVMFSSLPVCSAIRTNNLVAVGDAILTGRNEGMQTLDESIIQHFQAGRISEQTAMEYAQDRRRVTAALGKRAVVVCN